MQHDFILLDRSGSMAGRWNDALGAVNAYAKGLADANVDTGITLMGFDTSGFPILRDKITPKTFHPVTDKDVSPAGGTPLNDAIGRIVGLANAGYDGGKQYSRVALYIITDGEENSSREVDHQKAKDMLEACRKKDWQVTFIGCDFNNQSQAYSYGNAAQFTVSASIANMGSTMRMSAAKRTSYGVNGQAMNFTAEERAVLGSTDTERAAALVKKNLEDAAKISQGTRNA